MKVCTQNKNSKDINKQTETENMHQNSNHIIKTKEISTNKNAADDTIIYINVEENNCTTNQSNTQNMQSHIHTTIKRSKHSASKKTLQHVFAKQPRTFKQKRVT